MARSKKKQNIQRAQSAGHAAVVDVVPDVTETPVAELAKPLINAQTRGWPQWADKVYNLTGGLGGWIAFAIFVIVAWPIAIMVAGTAVVIVGTWGVSVLPATVISSLGASAPVMVSSTDGFLFNWIMPVAFLSIVLALVTMKLLTVVFGALWRYSLLLRQGLYAGREKIDRAQAKRERAIKRVTKKQAKEEKSQRKLDTIYEAQKAEDVLHKQDEQLEAEVADADSNELKQFAAAIKNADAGAVPVTKD